MDVMGIIQLFIPVITFAMGYLLTNIGYKRDRKLSIVREKFEKLYHPFYILINELGTDREEGIEIGGEDYSAIKPFLDHLKMNAYLASPEGQKLIWETRMLYISNSAKDAIYDKEKEQALNKSIEALFRHFIKEYAKSAAILGYEFVDTDACSRMAE